MATHSSILAWEIPGTEKPGGLQSMGSQKSQIGQDLWLNNSNNESETPGKLAKMVSNSPHSIRFWDEGENFTF